VTPYDTLRTLLTSATDTIAFPTTVPVNAMGEYVGPLPLIVYTVIASSPFPHLDGVPATRRYSVALDVWGKSFEEVQSVFAELGTLDGFHSADVQSFWLEDWSDLTEDPGYHRACSWVLVA